MPKFPLVLAAIFGVLAVVLWAGFVRPTTRQSDVGVIRTKIFKPAGQYVRYDVGANRGMRLPRQIPIAESYLFEIELEGRAEPVGFALNTTASEAFAVAQRVRVEYEQRGIPPFWRETFVFAMEPLGALAPQQH
jgi:hypothetical protein